MTIKHSILEVAHFFLDREKEKQDESDMTHLKLQKMCYYAQGVYMSVCEGSPLFPEDFEHWIHGPVCPELYEAYKDFKNRVIPPHQELFSPDLFTPQEREVLDDVYSYFGQYSAWKLRNMTHNESPWLNTSEKQVISKESMCEFFKKHVIHDNI